MCVKGIDFDTFLLLLLLDLGTVSTVWYLKKKLPILFCLKYFSLHTRWKLSFSFLKISGSKFTDNNVYDLFFSGLMRCGPAPLRAIKEGHVYLNYDVGFILSEVNGDKIVWQVNLLWWNSLYTHLGIHHISISEDVVV